MGQLGVGLGLQRAADVIMQLLQQRQARQLAEKQMAEDARRALQLEGFQERQTKMAEQTAAETRDQTQWLRSQAAAEATGDAPQTRAVIEALHPAVRAQYQQSQTLQGAPLTPRHPALEALMGPQSDASVSSGPLKGMTFDVPEPGRAPAEEFYTRNLTPGEAAQRAESMTRKRDKDLDEKRFTEGRRQFDVEQTTRTREHMDDVTLRRAQLNATIAQNNALLQDRGDARNAQALAGLQRAADTSFKLAEDAYARATDFTRTTPNHQPILLEYARERRRIAGILEENLRAFNAKLVTRQPLTAQDFARMEQQMQDADKAQRIADLRLEARLDPGKR